MKYTETTISGNYTKGMFIKPIGVVLHHTGEYSEKSIINTFTDQKSMASAHVVIWKDGRRTKFVADNLKAWHAGVSMHNGKVNCNNFMLGVEFQGDTNKTPLTENQIESFIEWFAPRKNQYMIKLENITDHRQISPGRKVDLNPIEFDRVINAIKRNIYFLT